MITTLTGSNSFGLKAELDQRIAEFVKKNGEFGLEKVDGEEAEYQQIYEGLTNLPFLASQKMVVLYTPSAQRDFTEKFESLIEQIPDSTIVLIVEPKLDKRTQYYKTLQKRTDFKEFNELDENALTNWLVNTAKAEKGALDRTTARYLVERVGANQQLLYSELQKLLAYNPKITQETIDLLTEPTPQSTIFELLEAGFNGRAKKALELYHNQRAQQVEPLAILAMIAWQLHVLALVSTAGKRSPREIASEGKINPFVVNKTLGLARRLSPTRVKEIIAKAADIDLRLKTTSIDPDEALQNLLLELA